MFNNVNAKKRLTQVIVAFVIICMAFTGSFLLLDDAISQASAVDRTVSTQGQWNTAMSESKSGETWNITLGGNISITSVTGGKLDPVKSGVTVNLNMNNYSITWDYMQNGGDWNSNLMATSYTSGTYANGEYWGLLTNNGTLNIQGTGTIRNKKIHITRQKDDRNDAVQRLAAIVNSGTLTVGSSIKVEAYLTSVHNSETSWSIASYSDNYLYNFGIYSNGGTVNSSANVSVGGIAGTSQTGTSGRAYNHCYGIYGNNSAKVNVSGGNIYVDSFSGGFMETGSGEKAHMYASSVGVFGNSAFISGNTTINVLSKNWEYQDQNNNTWKSGIDHLLSVGVMYVGSNYPVIGPSVDVVASFEHIGDNKTQIYVPGAGDAAYSWSDVFSDGDAGNISHVAAPIGGIASNPVNNIGAHTSETDYGAAFFGNTSPYESIKDRHQYLTAQSYYSGKKTTTVAPRTDNGSNDSTRNSAAIVNGAPGNTGTGGLTSTNIGNPGDHSPAASGFKVGSQYLFVYRFYTDVNNIESVSFRNDSGKLKNDATVTVGATQNVTNGIIPDDASKIFHSGGGEPNNSRFYSFEGAYYETVESSNASLKIRLDDLSADGKAKTPGNWKGAKGILPADGVTVSKDKDNVIIIYLDYKKHEATAVKVVATDKSVGINEYTESTSFTVPYTGATLVPGKDFNLGILDVAYGNAVVTEDYNYNYATGSGKPTVDYEYSSNGTSWTSGLPQNVGTYSIRVKVTADTTTNNRQGTQATLSCTITPGNVDITGGANSIKLTYGESYATIFDNYDFKAVNASGADITGSGSFTVSGNTLSTLPNAGTSSITIRWSPNDSGNYGASERTVTLEVLKKEITIGVAAKTVTYGDALPASSFELTYSTAGVAQDSSKLTGWLAATTFEVEKDGVWQAYGNGLPVGEYNFRISTFGGSSDSNYNFKIDSTPVKLTVTQRAIQYTATATDRVYEKGNKEVFVTLSNPTNAYSGDSFSAILNAKGTVDENAGTNKVTVDVNSVNVGNNNYYLVIVNADTLTANIAKADPTGVYVAAANPNIVYDKTKTLASVALAATENPEIPGTWAWSDPTIVPTVKSASESKYLAKFTPNSGNYNTLEQEVTLIVDKAVVQIVVDADASTPDTFEPFNVTYGDSVPALKQYMKYIGFTGDDTIDTVPHDGNADVSTDYNPTSGVREGGYTVSVNENIIADNYDFETVNNKIIVNKKALTITANDRTITYGDKAPVFKDSDVTATGFVNNETLSALSATFSFETAYRQNATLGKVGSYDINVDVVTSNNNYDITCVPGTLTVERKTLTLTPVAKTISYGAALPEYKTPGTDYTVDGLVNGDTTAVLGGTFAVSTQYKNTSYVNTYAITADVKGMTAENYKFVAGSGTLTVVKAVPSITTAPKASVVNSHTLADATFDNSAVIVNPNNSDLAVEGTFKFNSISTTPAWGSTTAYAATFTPADDINYTTATVNVVVEVTVKTISGIPVIQGSAMIGSELSVSLAAVDPSANVYTYQWYRVDGTVPEAISGATNAKYTVTEADFDKTIYVVIDADESKGFTGKAESAKTSKVIEALLATTRDMFNAIFPNDSTEVIYNANVYEVTVNVADAFAEHIFGDIHVKYNGSTAKPENAGTYNVTIDVDVPELKHSSYDDAPYQAPVSGMPVGTLVIKPATLTANVTASDKIYDGTVTAPANITFSGVYEEDFVTLATGAKFTFDNQNAGTDKKVTASNIVLTGDDAGNYVIDETTLTTTASILPREIYFIAEAKTKTYDKSATVEVQFEYDDITGKNDSDKSTGYAAIDNESTIYLMDSTGLASSINVGENIALVNGSIEYKDKRAGSSKENYIAKLSNEDDVRVEIVKANPVVVPLSITEVYGPTKTLGQINLKNYATEDGYWEFIDTTIVPTVQVKTYAARFVPSDLNNYNILETATITVNVTPLEVVLKADDKSVTYGANAPTYTFKPVSGITEDILATVGGSCKAVCYEYVPGTNVGVYEIVLNAAYSDPNYTFKTESGWLTVAKATINATATAESKVYDGFRDVKVNFAIQSGVYSADVGVVDLSVKSTTGTAATQNAGVTKVVSYEKPVLVGGKAGNYILNITPIEGALSVEILKADITGIEFPSGAQVEFGYDLSYATFENPGDAKGGSFAYENAKITVPGNLGVYDTYKVIYTPADAINYNTQEAYVTIQVVKCTLNYVVGVAGNLQSGQTLTAVATGLPAAANDYICYQWYRADGNDLVPIKGATDRTYVATDADVGYTLVVMTYFNDSDPFVFADDSFEIIENTKGVVGQSTDAIKEITLTFWQRLMNWLYRILAVLTGMQLNGGLGI